MDTMHVLKPEENARFSNKEMIVFILPVIFEQLMLGFLGIVDTFMVSSLGEISVAGVALVNRIDTFAKQFLSALGTGGGVVLAQYMGAKDKGNSKRALENNILIVPAIGFLVMALMLGFKSQIINIFFGDAEAEVLAISNKYFLFTALSYPFTALYYACNAEFRVMGRNNITLAGSIIMMAINIITKYILIYNFDMGVQGASLSTLIAMAVVGIVMLFELKSHRNKVFLDSVFKLRFDKNMAAKILGISVPNGVEQGMFQLGALLIAGLVSSLGTAAIASDHIARNLATFILCANTAFCSLMMTVVGQCIGANDVMDARRYIKHILKLNYVFSAVVVTIFFIFMNPIISAFNISSDAKKFATDILILYATCCVLLYPSSFALPSAFRGAGDTKYVMIVASASMFLFRIGAAYVLIKIFRVGVMGVWIAMVSDWVVRTFIFYIRYKGDKWYKNRIV